jgi:hypothetical protein
LSQTGIFWLFFIQLYCAGSHTVHALTASPLVLSMWLQTVKFICEKSPYICQFSSRNWFFCTKCVCILPWLVKGATQLCTSKKECNKLDLTLTQYFSLLDHNDWSRWFAISSPHVYAVPDIGGVAKKNR